MIPRKNIIRFLTMMGIVLSILSIIVVVSLRTYMVNMYDIMESDLYCISGKILKYRNDSERFYIILDDYSNTFTINDDYMDFLNQQVLKESLNKNINCTLYIFKDDVESLDSKYEIDIQSGYINQEKFLDFYDIKDFNSVGIIDYIVMAICIGLTIMFLYYYIHCDKVTFDGYDI